MAGDLRIALAGDVDRVPPHLLQSIAVEGVSFESVFDPNPGRAEQAARTYGARWPFDDLDQMLSEAEPDAVMIAAGETERIAWAKTCLRKRAGVLLLGSPGTRLTDCRALGKLARSHRVPVMVGQPHRFSPAGTRMRRLIESGKLGPLASVDLAITWPRTPDPDAVNELPLPFDLAFEAADRLRACGLEAERVWGIEQPYGHLAAIVLASNGTVVSVGLHHVGAPQTSGSHMEIRSGDGALLTIHDDVNLLCIAGSQLLARHHPRLGAGDDPRVECGFAGMVSSFVKSLREGQGVSYGLPSAAGSVSLAGALFKASRTNRPVTLRSR